MHRSRSLLSLLLVLLALLSAAPARAGSYEAALPAALATDPDLCAHLPCADVMPGAESFSPRMGRPPYVEAYSNEGGARKKIGYVFLSTDIVDIPAYSGKPVVTLMGMDTAGRFTGARILKHSEPILLVGIPEAALTKFIDQYVGKHAGDKVEVGQARAAEGYVGVDAITGATVTVIAQNQVMMRSAQAVARHVGILKSEAKPAARFAPVEEPMDWNALVEEGSIGHLAVQPRELGLPENGEPYIDLYFGYLNTPNVGRNVLGEKAWRQLMGQLKPDEHAFFIVANGSGSFKGSGFVRGGIYDRIQLAQDLDAYSFRDTDYLNLYHIAAAGALRFRESGIFILRHATFSAAYPWQLVFLANKLDKESGAKTFVNFDREYWLPARYLEGGRPEIVEPDAAWVAVWKAKRWEIAGFLLLLGFTTVAYASRDRLVRRAKRKDKRWVSIPKYLGWTLSIGFVGFYAMAQPSITQVLTWFHALLFQWQWELFLSDPFIFIFWWFIIATVFLWGRGLFCGWLCPFGALTELLHKAGTLLGLGRFQFKLPKPWHDRLKWVKYGVFFGLLAVSFFSMGLAERLAEVEPFKTTFLVGLLNRSWPYTLFAAGLLGLSIFMERPFCKYLCPLGAALAMPSTFRWFGLKRKQECTSCHACAHGCSSQAIDARGNIDQRECLLCLDCMVLYYDDHACPPLAQERKRRTRAGVALTPIGADGYFIPIRPVAPERRKEAA